MLSCQAEPRKLLCIGSRSLLYEEDPEIRRIFEEAFTKSGLEVKMPECRRAPIDMNEAFS
jgi:hypothetical protein